MSQIENPEAQLPPRRLLTRKASPALLGGVGALAIALAGVAYWRWHRPAALEVAEAAMPTAAAPAPAAAAMLPVAAAARSAAPAAHPSVAALLAQWVRPLSASAQWARWLGEPKLLQRLTAATRMVAEGESPRPVLSFLRPHGTFSASTRDGELVATRASDARYDLVTRVVTAIDPEKAGAAYVQLAPAFQRAFAEVGKPGEQFTPVLHKAIRHLLDTPVPTRAQPLEIKGANYVYTDARFESLSAAQKQLLRMGPANARKLQGWLGRFEHALPNRA